jgi:hypothetical protein
MELFKNMYGITNSETGPLGYSRQYRTSRKKIGLLQKTIQELLYEKVQERKTIGALRNRCLELALENDAEYILFGMMTIIIHPLVFQQELMPWKKILKPI